MIANAMDYVATRENINAITLDEIDSDINALNQSDTTAFLASGESDHTLDAGWFIPVSVGDTTFIDVNNDGIQNELDEAMTNVTVTLFDAATSMPATTNAYGFPIVPQVSDSNGFYEFDSLYPGSYYVHFDVSTAPNGMNYLVTTQNVNGTSLVNGDSDLDAMNFSDTTAFLTSGQSDHTLDAGWFLLTTVGDTTFVDVNVNGLQDAGDLPLAGVEVTLFDALTGLPITENVIGDTLLPEITNMDGAYHFDSLSPGQYYVYFDVSNLPNGTDYIPTLENVTGASLVPNDSDVNGLGLSDTTEFLTSNMVDLTLDAGWVLPSAVGDTTFVDVNGNGIQDLLDQPLEGVTVTLFDALTGNLVTSDAYGNPIVPQLTDQDGYYLFDSLYPVSYTHLTLPTTPYV